MTHNNAHPVIQGHLDALAQAHRPALPGPVGTAPIEPEVLVGPMSTEQAVQFATQRDAAFEADQRAYRELVLDFAKEAPELRGYTDVSELPGICADDMALLSRMHPAPVKQAFLADVQAKWDELRIEREADAETGGDLNRVSGREQLMRDLGMRPKDFF